ncbi:protein mono-ADP-ribosyltransferase PARP14 isoform X2 [Aplysia californica]|nr:protein mono-ADP-ribosyltransferase PARP14 isoform X2 [Aplysia californica]
MTRGPLSAHILKSCGQHIQDALWKVNDGQDLEHGQVVMVDEQAKHFKMFLFTCLYSWREGNDESLQECVWKCLMLAAEQGFTSVVFPALGMGGLRYPPKKVAAALINGVATYSALSKGDENMVEMVYITLIDEQMPVIEAFLQICLNEDTMEREEDVLVSVGDEGVYADSSSQDNIPPGRSPPGNAPSGQSSPQGKTPGTKMSSFVNTVMANGLLMLNLFGGRSNQLQYSKSKGNLHFKIRPAVNKKRIGVGAEIYIDVSFFTDFIPKALERFLELFRKKV